jgi:hypothetical protein
VFPLSITPGVAAGATLVTIALVYFVGRPVVRWARGKTYWQFWAAPPLLLGGMLAGGQAGLHTRYTTSGALPPKDTPAEHLPFYVKRTAELDARDAADRAAAVLPDGTCMPLATGGIVFGVLLLAVGGMRYDKDN